MLFRRGGQALREHREPLGEDRELAGLRAAQLAVDADDVAQVEALGERPVVADLLLTDEELNLAGHVADIDELQLALIAMQHDPPGGSHLRARHFAGPLLREPFAEIEIGAGRRQIGQRNLPPILQRETNFVRPPANVGDRRVIVEPRAPRIATHLGDPFAAFRGAMIPNRPRSGWWQAVRSRLNSCR